MSADSRPFPRWVPIVVVLAALAVFGAWVVNGIVQNPGFVYLRENNQAAWIGTAGPSSIKASLRAPVPLVFAQQFHLNAPLTSSTLHMTAFKSATVYIDNALIYQEALVDEWKFERVVPITTPIPAGDHTLIVICINDTGPPMLQLRWPDAGVYTDDFWNAGDAQGNRLSVREANDPAASPSLAHELPTVAESLAIVWPFLAVCIGVCATIALVIHRNSRAATKLAVLSSPITLRWVLITFLVVLGFHNQSLLRPDVGTDAKEHYKYLRYIGENYRLPPLIESGQSFQAPLFYGLAAIADRALSLVADEVSRDRLLRLLSVLCGIGLFEVTWRIARRYFAGNEHAQRLALLLAAFFPIAIVKSQVVGNEALAGFLGALAAYLTLTLATSEPAAARTSRFILAGGMWGLAILAKVSALVLAAPILLTWLWWAWKSSASRQKRGLAIGAYIVAAMAVSVWWFVRNQLLYGKAVFGGWDPLMGFEWWQFPGYRTLDQFTSFGAALTRPTYALVHGFWDGTYAGFWFDAEFSGVSEKNLGPTWNFPFATAAVALAILPTAALIAGIGRVLFMPTKDARASGVEIAGVFALFVFGAYMASILGHSLVLPYYNAIKSAYALAAVPFMVLLIVYGLEPLIRRYWGRVFVFTWMAAWVMLVGVGYWALAPD